MRVSLKSSPEISTLSTVNVMANSSAWIGRRTQSGVRAIRRIGGRLP